ncbi:uncharacterized protein [Watersipora subatra]|uniref:uncharacterized protein n=1 Tax=Watersipora subatra TaxID=2589382 RepID=UPI00355BCB19
MGIAKAMVPPDGVRGMLIAVIKLRLKQHEENLGREVWMTAYDRIYKALNSRGIYHEATDFDSPLIGRVGRKGDDFMSSEEKQRLIQLGAENDIVVSRVNPKLPYFLD